jgi:hypothetical protein
LLEKVEKAVIQTDKAVIKTDKDLTTNLDPKRLTFEPNSLAITSGKEDEEEEND